MFFFDLSAHAALTMALALALAWGADALFGDAPEAMRPAAWLRRVFWPLGCRLRVLRPKKAYRWGAVTWMVSVGGLGAIAWALQTQLLKLPVWASAPLLALLIGPLFSWRSLRDDVNLVEEALDVGDELARERLAPLVHRDVSGLKEQALRETAIETLAQQLSVSVIAPLFWFAVAGLPGAVAYRVSSTLARLWGLRGVWEWVGKWPARADDMLTWPPARITALALFPTWDAAAWRALRRQARRTTSPNAGWVMGAMALRLGVRLAKPGAYVLNETGAAPSQRNMAQALRHAGAAASACLMLALLAWAGRAMLA